MNFYEDNSEKISIKAIEKLKTDRNLRIKNEEPQIRSMNSCESESKNDPISNKSELKIKINKNKEDSNIISINYDEEESKMLIGNAMQKNKSLINERQKQIYDQFYEYEGKILIINLFYKFFEKQTFR
jgi:hypothetical protein